AWSVTQGSLPPGVTLAKEGSLRGTPNRTGLYRFQLEARDTGGHVVTTSFSITVSAPVSSTGPVLVATENQPAPAPEPPAIRPAPVTKQAAPPIAPPKPEEPKETK